MMLLMRNMQNFLYRLGLPLCILLFVGTTQLSNAAPPSAVRPSKGPRSHSLLRPLPSQVLIERLVYAEIKRNHYPPVTMNQQLGETILDQYLKDLDPERYFWTKSAVDQINQVDGPHFMHDLAKGNLGIAFAIARQFEERVRKRLQFVYQTLKIPFHFTRPGKFIYVRDTLPWVKDPAALNQVWRERIKSDLITLLLDKKTLPEAKTLLVRRYKNVLGRISTLSSHRVFDILMTAFAKSLDPHTSYFSPLASQQFQIAMSLQLEGIGAQLSLHNGYATIVRLLPGGPALASKKLHPGDRITAVGQGAAGTMVNVIGWRLQDIVEKIRGPKGSTVRLKILPAGETPGSPGELVTLVRATIQLKGQAAKGKVLPVRIHRHLYRVGVITLPAFYLNFQAKQDGLKDYRSTSHDMIKLIRKLTGEHICALVIDLRNNGGGSLAEALKTTGLFIGHGPVVQIESAQGVSVLQDPQSPMFYRGPLIVMVNRLSASASEIFTAALKDYHRALIVGSRTYGKATVQTLIPLNHYLPGFHAGELKLTIAKFYRVTGNSTQDRGILPQIPLPSVLSDRIFGEELSPHALPWTHIQATTFHAFHFGLDQKIPVLKHDFQQWTMNNPRFQLYVKGIHYMLENERLTSVPLSLLQRQQIRKQQDSEKLALDNDWLHLEHRPVVSRLPEIRKVKHFHIPDMSLKAAVYLAAQMYRMHLSPAGKANTASAESSGLQHTERPQ
jgi:carboxyl-terminal processing protease